MEAYEYPDSDDDENFIESREKWTRETRCLFPAEFIGPPEAMFKRLTAEDEDGIPKMRDVPGTEGKVKIERNFMIPGNKATLRAGTNQK